jgi:ppGpp synthetase/RelA/SpoT-type nucleotidyltranferase
MAEDLNQRILRQYDERVDLYRELANMVEGLIERILRDESIRILSVTSRVKEREKLKGA